MDNVAVTKSGDNCTYTGEYLWKKNTTMRFFAYCPQALDTCTISYDSVSLNGNLTDYDLTVNEGGSQGGTTSNYNEDNNSNIF